LYSRLQSIELTVPSVYHVEPHYRTSIPPLDQSTSLEIMMDRGDQ
jgi:hypothetical protein